jgi:hypothetical protein
MFPEAADSATDCGETWKPLSSETPTATPGTRRSGTVVPLLTAPGVGTAKFTHWEFSEGFRPRETSSTCVV